MKTRWFFILLMAGFCCLYAVLAGAENTSITDHQNLTGPYENAMAVTHDCLECHEEQGREVLHSAHWRWQGPSPHVQGLETRTDLGKKTLINNF